MRPVEARTQLLYAKLATSCTMQVLKTAQASGIEERSVVVKRLHAGSKGWGDKILERKQRLVVPLD